MNPTSSTPQQPSSTLQQASSTLGQPSSTLGVAELPEGLHGAYLRSSLVSQIGLPAVRSLIRVERLVRYSRHVLVDRVRTQDVTTRAAAALLTVGPEAVLTSHTSVLLHGCTAADSGVIHLLVRYGRQLRRRSDLVLHQGSFEERDVLKLEGLRILNLEAAIAEMLCTATRATALACADQALAGLDPTHRAPFRADVEQRIASRPDSRGQCRAAALLALATGLPESPAESRVLLAMFDAGLPIPEAQHSVCDLDGRERYRLDFAWPEPMVALEYDGYAAHADRADRDAARDEDLRRRGWLVVRATADDLRNPARLMSAVSTALDRPRSVA